MSDNPFDLAFDAAVPPPPTKPAPKPKVEPTVEKVAKARVTRDKAAVAQSDQDNGDDLEAMQAERTAALQAQIDAIEDGIYFRLPDTIYHAVPRLSVSGMQSLCVSPNTFWKGSWLDPERPELDEEQTKAQMLGKAYHCAILEPERFHDSYVRELSKAEMPKGTLFTGTDMGKALEEMGEKKSGSVAEQAQRLVDAGYDSTIWQVELAEWEAQRAGRISIAGEFFDKIVKEMERIHSDEDIAPLVRDGAAEVSVFYTDQHGIKMKARMDYLRSDLISDLKSYDNPKRMDLERCIANAIRYSRYYLQPVSYRDAAEAIRLGGLQIIGDATDHERQIIAEIQMRPDELAFHFIFMEKAVPNLLDVPFDFYNIPLATRINNAGATEEQIAEAGRATRTRTALFVRGAQDMLAAKKKFALYSSVYETGQEWALIDKKLPTSNLSMSTFWLEGKE